MKKFRIAIVSVLLGILALALTACGGASGVVSSYVSAVKKGDFEKAATYVVGNPDLEKAQKEKGDVYDYIYFESAKSFKMKVEETTENKDSDGNVTSYTVKISYTKAYTATAVAAEYALKTIGKEDSKDTAKEIIKGAKEASGDMTVVVVVSEGEKLLEAASATALCAAIWA